MRRTHEAPSHPPHGARPAAPGDASRRTIFSSQVFLSLRSKTIGWLSRLPQPDLRRDRMLLPSALAIALLPLLEAVGESMGL